MNTIDKILAAGVPAEWLDRELLRRAAYHFQRCGRFDEAAECLADAGDDEGAAGLYLRAGETGRAARLFVKAGRYDSAMEAYELMLEDASPRSAATRATALLGTSACLLLMKKDPEDARSRYAQARQIIEDETDRSPLDAGRCWEALGEYGTATGRYDLTYVGYETALVRYGEHHNRERLRAALAYLEAAKTNRLLAADLQDRIVQWSAVPMPETPVVLLRSEPKIVSTDDALEAFGLRWAEPEETGLSGRRRRPVSYIENQFEDRGETVFDRTTGLTWQKSGSDDWLNYERAEKYVEGLNRQPFAGHSDWRIPTLPELVSLLDPEKNDKGRYMNSLFDPKQWWCWSSDRLSAGGGAWVVGFNFGYVSWYNPTSGNYVRVCRS